MKSALLALVTVSLWSRTSSLAIKSESANCTDMKIHDMRVDGCTAEPCKIVKSKLVSIAVDFEFHKPKVGPAIAFFSKLKEWEHADGSTGPDGLLLDSWYGSDCEVLRISPCPATSGVKLTLKSFIMLDYQTWNKKLRRETGEAELEIEIMTLETDSKKVLSSCSFSLVVFVLG